MTETTDIKALMRPVRGRYDWSSAVWRDCDHCGKQHTGTVTAEDDSQICAHCADQLYWSAWQVLAEQALDQLEAERQQREAAEKERDELKSAHGNMIVRCALLRQRPDLPVDRIPAYEALVKAQEELAALRGTQEPVAWTDEQELRDMAKDGCAYLFKVDPANPYTDPRRQIMLFTRQPKPVVVLSDCTFEAVSHMAHWYSEGECVAWVSGVEHAKNQMLAAGIVVKDGE
ncbi:hypothetical protein [Ewingella americana]|uniref:hypothetical protein n=1 Tax=Ewingella americana TaxID=41202 RepID=UPI001639A08E|nr:hypothetical protein [Ewingella americana]QMV50924.1 hypothetical protein GXP68_05835 [Ewingella americana]